MTKTAPVASRAELEEGAANDSAHLCIGWVARGYGFGQLTFYAVGGQHGLTCDNECMSRRFCKTVLEKLTEGMPHGDLPPLIRRYQSLDALLDDSSPRHPVPDWPARKEGE